MTFSEQLDAARNAPRPTLDVTVILDQSIAAEKARLKAALSEADNDMRLATVSPAEEIQQKLIHLEEDSKDARVTFRFTRLPGRDWVSLTSTFPPRMNAEIDLHYGFNWDAVCEAAAAISGVRLDEDGNGIPLVVEQRSPENPAPKNDWVELFDILAGGEATLIRDTIWELNVWGPQREREALVKS